jgi:hypothetical protein
MKNVIISHTYKVWGGGILNTLLRPVYWGCGHELAPIAEPDV